MTLYDAFYWFANSVLQGALFGFLLGALIIFLPRISIKSSKIFNKYED